MPVIWRLNTDTWRIGYFGSTTLELENTLTSTLVVINTYMSGPLTFAIVLPPLYHNHNSTLALPMMCADEEFCVVSGRGALDEAVDTRDHGGCRGFGATATGCSFYFSTDNSHW